MPPMVRLGGWLGFGEQGDKASLITGHLVG
jgi:hypothetical protein